MSHDSLSSLLSFGRMDYIVRNVVFVSTKTLENIPELIGQLIDLASRHSFLKKQIPKAYYDLHEAVVKLRSTPILNAPAGPVRTGSSVDMATRFASRFS